MVNTFGYVVKILSFSILLYPTIKLYTAWTNHQKPPQRPKRYCLLTVQNIKQNQSIKMSHRKEFPIWLSGIRSVLPDHLSALLFYLFHTLHIFPLHPIYCRYIYPDIISTHLSPFFHFITFKHFFYCFHSIWHTLG